MYPGFQVDPVYLINDTTLSQCHLETIFICHVYLMTQFNCHLNAAPMCDIEHLFIFYYNYVFSCHLETVFMSHVDPVSISIVVTVIVPDKSS